MRMQDSQANCGPFALRNALQALGIVRTAGELESACRTTATDGTTVRNILRAAQKIEGCFPVLVKEKRRDVAMLKLRASLDYGRPVVLSWNSEEPGDHYVAAVGLIGTRYLVADSADNELILSLTAEQLEERWRGGNYEGVAL